MSLKRPGGFDITRRGLEVCNFNKGDKVLDIGSGDGDTANFLYEEYSLVPTAIDLNAEKIGKAKEKYPHIDFQIGDGEFLDSFSSRTFDGVLMECVLSEINLPLEAVHEAYCVLKKGGKLLISSLYWKALDDFNKKKVDEKVYDYQERHKQGTLSEEEKETPPSTYVFNKVLLMDRLRPDIEEIGFKELLFEDRTYDLTTYAAEIIMKEGSLDDYVPKEAHGKNTGYCLLVYEKV